MRQRKEAHDIRPLGWASCTSLFLVMVVDQRRLLRRHTFPTVPTGRDDFVGTLDQVQNGLVPDLQVIVFADPE